MTLDREMARHAALMSEYWSGPPTEGLPLQERLEGVVFSFFVMLDGAGEVPPCLIAPGEPTPESVHAELIPAWREHRPPGRAEQAWRAAWPDAAAPPLPHLPPLTRLMAVSRNLMGYFAAVRPASGEDFGVAERAGGLTFALLSLLAGEVAGAGRWSVVEDHGQHLPGHLNDHDLHGVWSRYVSEWRALN